MVRYMTKSVKIILICVIAVFAVSAAISVYILRPTENKKVVVIRDNTELYSFDLSAEKDEKIRIEYEGGGYNIVEIKNGEIRISEADCPDNTCVKSGTLKHEEMPVVCLPHHLILRFSDDE